MWKPCNGSRKPPFSRMGVSKWSCHGDKTILHFKTITALQKKRLESLKRKLRRDVTLYNEVVDKVTTKLRVVFDASTHEDRSPSLNDS